MIFVWALESVLLAFIAWGVADFLSVSATFAQTQLAISCVTMTFYVGARAVDQMSYASSAACMHLSATAATTLLFWDNSLSMFSLLFLASSAVQIFMGVAACFCTALGFTPLLFDRYAFILLPFGLFLRNGPHWLFVIGVVTVLCVAAVLHFVDRMYSTAVLLLLCIGLIGYEVLVSPTVFNIVFSVSSLLVAGVWFALSSGQPPSDYNPVVPSAPPVPSASAVPLVQEGSELRIPDYWMMSDAHRQPDKKFR